MKGIHECDDEARHSGMSEHELELLFDNMVSPFSYYRMLYDSEGNPADYVFLAVNHAFEVETGLTKEQVVGRRVLEILPLTETYWIENLGRVAKTGIPESFQNYAAALDNWYQVTAYSPRPDHFAITVANITEIVRKREELVQINRELEAKNVQLISTNRLLEENQHFLSEAQLIAHIGSYSSDLMTGKWYGSPELNRIFGVGDAEAHELADWFDLVHPEDRESFLDYYALVLAKAERFDYVYRILRPGDGQERWVHGVGEMERDNVGRPIRIIGTIQDITERRQAENEIRYLSFHDKLTGLFNRRYCEEQLVEMDLLRNLPLSVIVGDVNGLKLINDAFGHDKGDVLLTKAAGAFRGACREGDLIARWGGDEFVVLLPHADDQVVERIVHRIREIYAEHKVHSLNLQISLGWDTKRTPDEELMKRLKNAENHMYRNKILENAGMRVNAINTIIHALHVRNPLEEVHSKQVSEICVQIGSVLGFSERELDRLKLFGLLHDIGKIAVEDEVLANPNPLTPSEWEDIHRHSDIGYRIISSSYEMQDIAECVIAHHERWDGTGYPKGLRGEEIPLYARILAIADAYEAMVSVRPYRPELSEVQAVAEFIRHAGTQFDPELARLFVERVLRHVWTGDE